MLTKLLSRHQSTRPIDASPTNPTRYPQIDLASLGEDSPSWPESLAAIELAIASGKLPPELAELARLLPKRMSSRRAAVALTQSVARLDPEFASWQSTGDASRDAGHWGSAEHAYWRVLGLYPFFGGYRVQYAHALKEQGKHFYASLEYYSALAAGAATQDVVPHLVHSLSKTHHLLNGDWVRKAEAFWSASPDLIEPLSYPPMRRDVELLVELLHNRGDLSPERCLSLLSGNSNLQGLIRSLIAHPDFSAANRNLLRMVSAGSDLL